MNKTLARHHKELEARQRREVMIIATIFATLANVFVVFQILSAIIGA